ncbi:MAG: hypothetical protein ACI9LM_003756 [Alteromonadaceae bacterium]|jgi:uncharacterized protein (DUF2235 family)
MAKNIVILSDGTGQEGGKAYNTNVYKVFNMIKDRSHEQIAFYDQGLGSGWNKVASSLFGMGMTKNILSCYRFIFEHYEVGDKIYLFGFSRGAATVRSLSGFIHLFGMLPKSRPELITRAWTIYKTKNLQDRHHLAEEFLAKNKNIWCNVEFLGVWDTVAALGIPIKPLDSILSLFPFFQYNFHDFTVSESVNHAYHALAIDDCRQTFHPLVFRKKNKSNQTVKQVWFCGSHTDVGGGYEVSGLSDIPLVWMLDMAIAHGLEIFDTSYVLINQNVNAIMHDETKSFPGRLLRRKSRSWSSVINPKPIVHASVLSRKLNQENLPQASYQPWILDNDYSVEPWNESNKIKHTG